jgi:hypothetical protein
VLDQPVDRRTPRHPLRDACHPRITDRSASFETSAEDLAGNVGHVVIRLAAPAERQIPDAQRGPPGQFSRCIPFDALESLPDSGIPTDSKPSARHRQTQLLDALARLQEAVEAQTPQDADLIYETLNGAFETSRGRRLER